MKKKVDLCQSVSSVASRQHLRSANRGLLVVPRYRLGSYSRRAFLWLALRYGTGYQTVWETGPSAETPSDVHWRRFYFQLTCAHSALELSGRCALQIYLLTYLLTLWVYLELGKRVLWLQTSFSFCWMKEKNQNSDRHLLKLWWRSGVVVSMLASINEVNLRRARLVRRWVAMSRFHSQCRIFISVCNQPPEANSAFRLSGVGKWVPASAGKAKTYTLEVWSRQGAIQIHVYVTWPLPLNITSRLVCFNIHNIPQLWPCNWQWTDTASTTAVCLTTTAGGLA